MQGVLPGILCKPILEAQAFGRKDGCFMLRYIAKRLLLLIPVVLGVSLIIFLIMSLTPGDPAMLILGEGAPPGIPGGGP